MGNLTSKTNTKKDRQVLSEFLKGTGNLDKIWNRFDKDGNGSIDENELEELIYCSLCIFCVERDPNMAEPPRKYCEPFIKQITAKLKPMLDSNHDGVISREEFEEFGKYLNDEYNKLKNEIHKAQIRA